MISIYYFVKNLFKVDEHNEGWKRYFKHRDGTTDNLKIDNAITELYNFYPNRMPASFINSIVVGNMVIREVKNKKKPFVKSFNGREDQDRLILMLKASGYVDVVELSADDITSGLTSEGLEIVLKYGSYGNYMKQYRVNHFKEMYNLVIAHWVTWITIIAGIITIIAIFL